MLCVVGWLFEKEENFSTYIGSNYDIDEKGIGLIISGAKSLLTLMGNVNQSKDSA